MLDRHQTTTIAHSSLHWTRAQKRDLRNYQAGMILTFHRKTRDFAAGQWAEVKAVEAGMLHLLKPDGQKVRVSRKQCACFDVASQVELPVAKGERLLLKGNRKEEKLFNGQIVTVQQARPDGTIALDDGRIMPADFRAYTYGYCVTSHASQGRTVDHVHVAVDSHTLNAAHLKQFYVSTSRGREQVRIYTDDTGFLAEAIAKSGDRLSATELVEAGRAAMRHKAAERTGQSQGMKI